MYCGFAPTSNVTIPWAVMATLLLKTPNLDRLAQMGVRFQNACSQSPRYVAPSRASFLDRAISPHLRSAPRMDRISPPGERLLPKIFVRAGVYLRAFRKAAYLGLHARPHAKSSSPRIDDGYDYFRWSHHPAGIDRGGSWPANEYSLWLTRHGQTYQSPARADCKICGDRHAGGVGPGPKWCTDCALEYMDSAHRFGIPPAVFSELFRSPPLL